MVIFLLFDLTKEKKKRWEDREEAEIETNSSTSSNFFFFDVMAIFFFNCYWIQRKFMLLDVMLKNLVSTKVQKSIFIFFFK